ncbi:transposase [Methyloversatilis sp.]|jgi:transposase|uniref:IS66-like element accessory protein TnpA n=1 Tax=Methyloversatilis sp. TaxID=2569862 RepID=UPI0027369EF4|nr:transposase [Methyloversatilis sp.]MDP3578827.1 transposase [Methyloversatilis sp.]
MDTNPRTGRAYKRGPYKRHPVAFKRAVVEASFAPGASVSRVAREHDINANQVFLWRKLYQDGLLGDDEPALLPVHIDASVRARATARSAAPVEPIRTPAPGGTLTIEFGTVRLHIEGRPDADTLAQVLAQLAARC